MKKNYILAVVFLTICFGLTIGALIFVVMEKVDESTYLGMAASAVGFMSCLFGLNSWKEK